MAVSNFTYLLFFTILSSCVVSEKYKLGGIFEHYQRRQANMFRLAAMVSGVDLATETVEAHKYLVASQAVCRMKREGVAGIFVPPTGTTLDHAASECHALDVPFVGNLVNVYYQPHFLTEVYVELIKALKWHTFTLLYEDNYRLQQLSQLLKSFSSVTVRQLWANNTYTSVLQEIRDSGDRNILLDCRTGRLPQVLKLAQQVGLITPDYSYIITSMDLHTLDLEPYKYAGANILGLNALDSDNEALQVLKLEARNVNTTSALVHDSVLMYVHVLRQLNLTFATRECVPETEPKYVSSVANFIKNNSVSIHGITGRVDLDREGNRTNIEFKILQLQEEGLAVVGKWNTSDKLKFKLPPRQLKSKSKLLPGKHFKIMTILSSPYVMRKHSADHLHGNDKFEGFAIDMLEEISKILGFTYELEVNFEYGSLDPQTNKWTGMLQQLQLRRADMIVADLTITTERHAAFEFTMPFINTGISILYYKPSPHIGVSLLAIFSIRLWLYLILSVLFVSLMFFLLARLSPFQRKSVQGPDTFTLSNSLWFTIASLRPLGCGIEPRSLSMRFMAQLWWHFVALMVAAYVSGWVALMNSDGPSELPIKNVHDLAHQEDIRFGAVRRGSTMNFFRESGDPMYQHMYTNMVSSPDVLMPSIEAGVERVKTDQGSYAFLTDSLSIEYAVMCDPTLVQIGGLLDYKGYGIALPLGSPYRKAMNGALLRMKESGKLVSLKIHWWHRPCQRNDAIRKYSAQFEYRNVYQLFLLLLIVCIGAVCIALLERRMRKSAKGGNPTIRITEPTPQVTPRPSQRR